MDDESGEIATAGTTRSSASIPVLHGPDLQHGLGREDRATHNLQINGGNLTYAGRDVHNHTHIHEAPTVDLMSVIQAVDNFRKVQQGILNTEMPKIGQRMFEHEVRQSPDGTALNQPFPSPVHPQVSIGLSTLVLISFAFPVGHYLRRGS
ncbi:hypothetical protein BKA70DRAFT_1272235 [Coprinopsis sp. MPI-PUGE-AT-0042]|nr:hypothetical protein BKA70DRAFT_1272235 [Coprinopsis sp. MPI-PUGE-AT-0042]